MNDVHKQQWQKNSPLLSTWARAQCSRLLPRHQVYLTLLHNSKADTHTHTRSPKKESDSCGCFTPVGDIMWLCSFIAYALTLPFKQKIMPVSYANAVLSLHTRVLPGVLVTCASSNKKVSAPLDNHHRGFVFAPVATLAGPLASHTVRAVLIPAPCLPVCLQI